MSPEIAFVVGAIALYSIYQLVKAAKQELANERLRVEGELSKELLEKEAAMQEFEANERREKQERYLGSGPINSLA